MGRRNIDFIALNMGKIANIIKDPLLSFLARLDKFEKLFFFVKDFSLPKFAHMFIEKGLEHFQDISDVVDESHLIDNANLLHLV